jgi:tRNA pseudouridine55 synthase
MNGFLVIDKPSGMTSHDVVAKVRKRLGTKRVGHAGTLDPMATGVLVVGVGNATKLLQYIVDGTKSYEGTIALGASTHTDDKEGDLTFTADPAKLSLITDAQIREKINSFVGTIMQKPSAVSAIKIDGKAAHQRVRDGEVVDLPARETTISKIDIHSIEHTVGAILVAVTVDCSAGTYIRAIARDLGDLLEVGGHLTSLRRTLVSPFSLRESGDIESIERADLIDTAIGIARVLPTRDLDFEEMTEISFGRSVTANPANGIYAALSPTNTFAALLENKDLGGKVAATPKLVAVQE